MLQTQPLLNSKLIRRLFGRDGGIRTRDPLHPMQVRYQAALRPEEADFSMIQGTLRVPDRS